MKLGRHLSPSFVLRQAQHERLSFAQQDWPSFDSAVIFGPFALSLSKGGPCGVRRR